MAKKIRKASTMSATMYEKAANVKAIFGGQGFRRVPLIQRVLLAPVVPSPAFFFLFFSFSVCCSRVARSMNICIFCLV